MPPIYIWFMTRADGQGFLIHIQWRDDLHALAGAAGAAAGPVLRTGLSAVRARNEKRSAAVAAEEVTVKKSFGKKE